MARHFLSILDLTTEEIHALFRLAADLKDKQKAGRTEPLLKGKTLAMIFQKPSARTRVSFEVGMLQLGGHAIYLGPSDVGMGKRETPADLGRLLSRYVDGIMARVFGHHLIEELAAYATVPVINGLTDFNHPCQILGDLMTIQEHRGSLNGLTVAYVGDGNNIVHSWLEASARIPFTLRLACPEGYDPQPEMVEMARKAGLSAIHLYRDPREAVRGADVIYTDVWASMGQEDQAEARKKVFRPYQVNESLVALAKPEVLILHCLPAHRGEEITPGVIDGPRSIVFDEAENRLHIQKAILVTLMST